MRKNECCSTDSALKAIEQRDFTRMEHITAWCLEDERQASTPLVVHDVAKALDPNSTTPDALVKVDV